MRLNWRAGCTLGSLIMCLLAGVPRVSEGSQEFSKADFIEDFEFLWDSFSNEYAYLEEVSIDWQKVRGNYFRQVETAATLDSFMAVVERVLEELCDNHVHLTASASASPRIVPARSDLHARWQEGRAVIKAVRGGFAADASGLRPGDIVIDLDKTPIEELVDSRLPVAAADITAGMRNCVLNRVLAGYRGIDRHVRVQREAQELVFTVEAGTFDRIYNHQRATQLDGRWLPDGVGYIRFNDSLGDGSVVGVFDSVLEKFESAAGLIVDLRRVGGGSTAVLERIAGRFLDSEVAYQRTQDRSGRYRFSYVEPRGAFQYLKPLVVLVGPWTGSVGEGLAISLSALGRAQTVGLRMAGLEGGVFLRRMPHTKLGFQITGEKIHNGVLKDGAFQPTPRTGYLPDVMVDLMLGSENGGDSDRILETGLRVLRTEISRVDG